MAIPSHEGPKTWRLKFDVGRNPATGKRVTKYVTFHGTKREAQTELARLLTAVKSGSFIDSSKATVVTYLRSWIEIAERRMRLLRMQSRRS
jgi:hypothetical protein